MAMVEWCGAVARRVLVTSRRPPFISFSLSSSSSSSATVPALASAGGIGEAMVCGRGDKRTKRFKGSYGNARPKEKKIERIKDKVEVPRSTSWPLPFKLI